MPFVTIPTDSSLTTIPTDASLTTIPTRSLPTRSASRRFASAFRAFAVCSLRHGPSRLVDVSHSLLLRQSNIGCGELVGNVSHPCHPQGGHTIPSPNPNPRTLGRTVERHASEYWRCDACPVSVLRCLAKIVTLKPATRPHAQLIPRPEGFLSWG